MSKNWSIHIDKGNYIEQNGNFGIGQMSGGVIKGNAQVIGVIHEAEPKNLAETVAEIENLIKQLEQSRLTNTTEEQKMVANEIIVHLENNPTRKQKAIAALKQGSLNLIETHPIGTFVVGAIKGWQKKET